MQEQSEETGERNQPLVSIVTVVYNNVEMLEPTIRSVINQTYPHIEYVVIDGGSTDGTVDVIRRHKDEIAYWVSEPDEGIYDAMNKGIDQTTGEVIGILNSGDWYLEDTVGTVVNAYLSTALEGENQIITGNMVRVNDAGESMFEIKRDKSALEQRISNAMPLNHPATFVTRSTYRNIGRFNTRYSLCADYDLIYRAYYSGCVQFTFVNERLAYMELGGISEQFQSYWRRAIEHFQIREQRVSKTRNVLLSARSLLKYWAKHVFKALSKPRWVSVYYAWRHGQV